VERTPFRFPDLDVRDLLERTAREDAISVPFLDAPACDLAGRTVLILGFGRIGRRLAPRCRAMEMTVLVHDPYVVQDAITTAGATPVEDWRAALPAIDFLSVNCPKNEETDGMIGAAELAAMIPGARYKTMPGLGHFPMSEHPQKFLDEIRPVLQRILAH